MQPLIKNFVSEGTNEEYRIVMAGTAGRQAKQATAAANNILGLNTQPKTTNDKERMDVVQAGEGEVLCGGAIPAGRSFTSDANGKAVLANTGERAAGTLQEAGADGQIIPCLVFPHTA